jgi:lactoylglutathione lyase
MNADETGVRVLINIDVDDLERAAHFYRDAFGLRSGRRLGIGVMELLGAGAPIYLLAKPAGSRVAKTTTQKRDYRRHWTPLHLDFVVDDVDAALGKAIAAGARQEGAIETHAWGYIVHCADPFGHGFCLLQFIGRGYDEPAD